MALGSLRGGDFVARLLLSPPADAVAPTRLSPSRLFLDRRLSDDELEAAGAVDGPAWPSCSASRGVRSVLVSRPATAVVELSRSGVDDAVRRSDIVYPLFSLKTLLATTTLVLPRR